MAVRRPARCGMLAPTFASLIDEAMTSRQSEREGRKEGRREGRKERAGTGRQARTSTSSTSTYENTMAAPASQLRVRQLPFVLTGFSFIS